MSPQSTKINIYCLPERQEMSQINNYRLQHSSCLIQILHSCYSFTSKSYSDAVEMLFKSHMYGYQSLPKNFLKVMGLLVKKNNAMFTNRSRKSGVKMHMFFSGGVQENPTFMY